MRNTCSLALGTVSFGLANDHAFKALRLTSELIAQPSRQESEIQMKRWGTMCLATLILNFTPAKGDALEPHQYVVNLGNCGIFDTLEDAEACLRGASSSFSDSQLTTSTVGSDGMLSLNYRPAGGLTKEVARPPSPGRVNGPYVGLQSAGPYETCLNQRLPAHNESGKPPGWANAVNYPLFTEFSDYSTFNSGGNCSSLKPTNGLANALGRCITNDFNEYNPAHPRNLISWMGNQQYDAVFSQQDPFSITTSTGATLSGKIVSALGKVATSGPTSGERNQLRTYTYGTNCSFTLETAQRFFYRRGYTFLCDAGYTPSIPTGPLALASFSTALRGACRSATDHDSFGICGLTQPTYGKGGTTRPVIATPSQTDSCPQEGNPCSPGTGNKTLTEQDIVLPTMAFERHYNSLREVRTNAMIDLNWSHSYSARLLTSTSIASMTCVSCVDATIWMVTDRGHLEKFSRIGATNRYRSENNLGEQLQCEGSTFTWIGNDGRRRIFDAYGLLMTEIDPSKPERSIVLTWDSSFDDKIPRLTTIRDARGRALTLEYGAGPYSQGYPSELQFSSNFGAKLTAIRLGTGPNAPILARYTYKTQRQLATVEYPGSYTRYYDYGQTPWVPARANPFSYHLTRVSDVFQLEDGSSVSQLYANYGYDSRGRAAKSQHANGTGKVELEYLADGTVSVLQPGGLSRNLYTFAPSTDVGNFRKPLSHAVQILDPKGAVQSSYVKTEWVYFTNGRVKQRKDYRSPSDYSITKYFYDGDTSGADNNTGRRETRRIEAFGTLQQRTIDQTWDYGINRLTKRTITDASGVASRVEFEYDPNGALLAECTFGNIAVKYACSASGAAPAEVRRTTYEYCGSLGNGCGLIGQLKRVDGPRIDVSDLTTYTYYITNDSTGRYRAGDLWKLQNAAGHVTEYLRYDDQGRPLEWLDPNYVGHLASYDQRGRKLSETVLGPDPQTTADDAVTSYSYNHRGKIRRITRPDLTEVSFEFDHDQRLTDAIAGDGTRIHYDYDDWGNRTREEIRDSNGAIRRLSARQYDQLGRLRSTINAPYADQLNLDDPSVKKTTYSYDANGNLDLTNDALGRISDNDYDPLNRLIQSIQDKDTPEATGEIAATVKYAYDARDNLRRVVDPNQLVTDYTYDGLNNQTRLDSPDSGATIYTYDEAGNRASQTDARGVTGSYVYDALNRLQSISYPSDPAKNIVFVYDLVQAECISGESFGIGRLTKVTDASGQTRMCYDRTGNLTRKVQITKGRTLAVRYHYNKANRIVATEYPSGVSVGFTRDAVGRVQTANVSYMGTSVSLIDNIAYRPFGPMSVVSFANGQTLAKEWDQNYWPKTVGSPAFNYEFTTNPIGTITDIASTSDPGRSYGYDRLDRLQEVRDSNQVLIESYTYDATGNRTSRTQGGNTEAYLYNNDPGAPVMPGSPEYGDYSHRLNVAPGNSFGKATPAPPWPWRLYDDAGNTLSIRAGVGSTEFAFDSRNRLTEHRQIVNFYPTVPSTEYDYNGTGERVWKRLNSGSASGAIEQYAYVYDQAGQRLGGYQLTGADTWSVVDEVIWLDNTPVAVARINAGQLTLQAVMSDHLNSPRALTTLLGGNQPLGTTVWKWSLTAQTPNGNNAFGNELAHQDPDANGSVTGFDLRFPGQQFDAETGLHYNYFRDYEPQTGRYVESDPIGLDGGASTYGYVAGSPLRFSDPQGLCRCLYYAKSYPYGTPNFAPWFWETYDATFNCTYHCTSDEDNAFNISVDVTVARGWFDDPNEMFVCPHVQVSWRSLPSYPYSAMQIETDFFDPRSSPNEEIRDEGREKCSCKK